MHRYTQRRRHDLARPFLAVPMAMARHMRPLPSCSTSGTSSHTLLTSANCNADTKQAAERHPKQKSCAQHSSKSSLLSPCVPVCVNCEYTGTGCYLFLFFFPFTSTESSHRNLFGLCRRLSGGCKRFCLLASGSAERVFLLPSVPLSVGWLPGWQRKSLTPIPLLLESTKLAAAVVVVV